MDWVTGWIGRFSGPAACWFAPCSRLAIFAAIIALWLSGRWRRCGCLPPVDKRGVTLCHARALLAGFLKLVGELFEDRGAAAQAFGKPLEAFRGRNPHAAGPCSNGLVADPGILGKLPHSHRTLGNRFTHKHFNPFPVWSALHEI